MSNIWTIAELTHPVSVSSQFGKPSVKFIADKKMELMHIVATGENAFDRLMASVRSLDQDKQQSTQPCTMTSPT